VALAASRDLVAAQYAHGFPAVFDPGLATFVESLARARHEGCAPARAARRAMLRAFLEFLAAFPDSHIVRKHGAALAHSVMAEAAPWCERARRGEAIEDEPGLAEWDESLKWRGLNPGTCADLAVATALLAALAEPALSAAPDAGDGA
jgi:triphosphoribosyl-dephospho-CoA synthase